MVANGLNGVMVGGKEGVVVSGEVSTGDSSAVFGGTSLSNMLNSPVKFAAWTLRLFADGLPRDTRSRFIIPSLRFSGLTVAYVPNVPLRRFSIRESAGRGPRVGSVHAGVSVGQVSPAALSD